MQMLHVYLVNKCDMVIAESSDSAITAWLSHTGEHEDDYDLRSNIEQIDDCKLIRFVDTDDLVKHQMACKLAKEFGVGVFASSEW